MNPNLTSVSLGPGWKYRNLAPRLGLLNRMQICLSLLGESENHTTLVMYKQNRYGKLGVLLIIYYKLNCARMKNEWNEWRNESQDSGTLECWLIWKERRHLQIFFLIVIKHEGEWMGYMMPPFLQAVLTILCSSLFKAFLQGSHGTWRMFSRSGMQLGMKKGQLM